MINKKRLINTFIKLIKIPKKSGEEKQLTKFVFNELKRLNLKVWRDKTGNIIANKKEKVGLKEKSVLPKETFKGAKNLDFNQIKSKRGNEIFHKTIDRINQYLIFYKKYVIICYNNLKLKIAIDK